MEGVEEMTYKTDANQAEIVKALRAMGATVVSLASVKHGCPDLLVGWRGYNYLIEVKNMDGRGDRLTPDEQVFFDGWNGQVTIFRCVEDAIAFLENAED